MADPAYHRARRARLRVQSPRLLWASEVLQASRARARRLGLEHTLDRDAILALAPEVCPVLGVALRYGDSTRADKKHAASLDRRDNTRGYTADNVSVISVRANEMKRDTSLEEMRRLVQYMEQAHG